MNKIILILLISVNTYSISNRVFTDDKNIRYEFIVNSKEKTFLSSNCKNVCQAKNSLGSVTAKGVDSKFGQNPG